MMSAADKDDISEVIMTDSEHYKDSITEIQTRLRELHYAGYPIDLIIPDGIYDILYYAYILAGTSKAQAARIF